MALSEKDQAVIDQYRKQFEDALAGDERFGSAERADRQDGSLLATRFTIAPDVWLELAIRPAARQPAANAALRGAVYLSRVGGRYARGRPAARDPVPTDQENRVGAKTW